jgi:hypothetical protein
MTEIDELADDPQAATDPEVRAAIRAAVDRLPTPAQADARAFGTHYAQYLQDSADTAMAHAAVKQALQAWPKLATAAPPLAEYVGRVRDKTRR